MNWLSGFFGKKTPDSIQEQIKTLDTKCAADRSALEAELSKAQGNVSGTADIQKGGRRRKHKGTRRHKKSKSRRVRTGRKSSRL